MIVLTPAMQTRAALVREAMTLRPASILSQLEQAGPEFRSLLRVALSGAVTETPIATAYQRDLARQRLLEGLNKQAERADRRASAALLRSGVSPP